MDKTIGETAQLSRRVDMENPALVNILIVEDDDFQRKIIESSVGDAGYSYVSVKEGHTAIEKLKQEKFHLVISDVNMPGGISGFNLVKTVRGVENLGYIPFIFVTGRRDKADIERAIKSGVDDYVIKPIDKDMLLAKVEALVSKNTGGFSFSERPAQSPAHLEFELQVVGLSEQAIQFISPISLPLNYKFKIKSAIFEDVGIESPKLRVTSCEPNSTPEGSNRIRANFIGLNDREMSSIRKWVMANSRVKSKLA
jgi:CheY-like chemotaxis protein